MRHNLSDVQSLVRWLRTVRPDGRFLELGTSLGVTTAHLTTSGWHIDTWEGCPDTLQLAQEGWKEVRLSAEEGTGTERGANKSMDVIV